MIPPNILETLAAGKLDPATIAQLAASAKIDPALVAQFLAPQVRLRDFPLPSCR